MNNGPTLSGFIIGESNDSRTTYYQYDELNQLIAVTTGNTVASYTYNGEGLRVSKNVNGEITKYLYEYDKIVLEIDGNGVQSSKNIYGAELIAKTIGTTTYYY